MKYFVAQIPVSDWNDSETQSSGRELEIEEFDTKEELIKHLDFSKDRVQKIIYGTEMTIMGILLND